MNRRAFARHAAVLAATAALPLAARAADSWRDLAADGEARLAEGSADGARAAFEAAAGQVHAAEVELGIVHSLMQAGAYRQALAFAAHVAGAHQDEPRGTALYAWLLNAGGQDHVAQRLLAAALTAAPDDVALLEVDARLHLPWPYPGSMLMAPPLRAAPYGWPVRPPGDAGVAASALLVAGGRQALAPTEALAEGRALWLRNGMGQTVAAEVERRDDTAGLALLRAAAPLPAAVALRISAHEPFAGSPCSIVAYMAHASGAPTWPLLRVGFFARTPPGATARPLGLDVPPGAHGGPVFDAAGHLAGIALKGAGGEARLLGSAALEAWMGDAPAPVAGTAAAPRAALDAVYEGALRTALQLIVQRY